VTYSRVVLVDEEDFAVKQLRAAFTFFVLAALPTAEAHAQTTRTWVSSNGSDSNLCTRTAPCQTFAGALAKTSAGGEISVVDASDYGPVTISKSITLNGDGALAGILAPSTNGVIVNAGVNDRVVLRNISINGVGTGLNGVRFIAGKELTVEHVSISGFTGIGIDMSQANESHLFVKDTQITNVATGIFVTATGGQARATLDNVHLTGNATGLQVSTGGYAMISDSVISGNTFGIYASSSALVNVENCKIAFNGYGVTALTSASIGLSKSQIYSNSYGIYYTGAYVFSSSNNAVFKNTNSLPPTSEIPLE
jgi:hypothetical protein